MEVVQGDGRVMALRISESPSNQAVLAANILSELLRPANDIRASGFRSLDRWDTSRTVRDHFRRNPRKFSEPISANFQSPDDFQSPNAVRRLLAQRIMVRRPQIAVICSSDDTPETTRLPPKLGDSFGDDVFGERYSPPRRTVFTTDCFATSRRLVEVDAKSAVTPFRLDCTFGDPDQRTDAFSETFGELFGTPILQNFRVQRRSSECQSPAVALLGRTPNTTLYPGFDPLDGCSTENEATHVQAGGIVAEQFPLHSTTLS